MNTGDKLTHFLHSRKWKTIQNYTYSFGASVVLIGALAKLEHWPMASAFLMTGLGMEALIFFISAFEPLMENHDWKKVYPQLREGDESASTVERYRILDEKYLGDGKMLGGSGGTSSGGSSSGGSGTGGSISIKDLPAEQVKKLNESFEKLSEAAMGLKNISSATLATEGFVKNLQDASQSIGLVVESNKKVSVEMEKNVQEISHSYVNAAKTIQQSTEKASEGITQSVSELSGAVKQTGESLKSSGEKAGSSIAESVSQLSASVKSNTDGLKAGTEKLTSDIQKASTDFTKNLQDSVHEMNDSYKKIAESLSGGFKGLEKSSSKYVDNIEKLNKNLTALNTAYELNLKGAGKVEEVVKQYSGTVGEIGKLLNSSVEETRKFNESTKEINENIQALNKVYGRMLGALNTKK
jgi:gliding motility-associated protein GldL